MTIMGDLLKRLAALRTSSIHPPTDSDGIRQAFIASFAMVFLLVVGVGGWATAWPLASAVVAQGTVVVDSNIRKVQHPTGGVVAEIRVRDGDRVLEGDLLVLLDETITRVSLQIVVKQLDGLAIRRARLAAERDGAEAIGLPPVLLQNKNEPEMAAMIVAEQRLFDSRRRARDGQKAQLRERKTQLQEEIAGYEAQENAKAQEIALIRIELKGLQQLWEQKLVSLTKMTQYQRDEARLTGERAQMVTAAAQAKGRISEFDLQILQIDHDLQTEVMKELREAQDKEAELIEKRVAAEDTLKRLALRAPQSGVVHQLNVHTVGGVVGQSEQLMLIVPDADLLAIETKVAPRDIDQVRIGQPAFVRFSAFDQHTTPEFEGTVTHVSADVTKDKEAPPGSASYTVRVALAHKDVRAATGLRLLPGMPAEVHIVSGKRTAMSYLMKPLRDQFARAFIEK